MTAIVVIGLVLILLIALLVFLAFRTGLIAKGQAARPRPDRAADEIAPPMSLGTAVSIALQELRNRTGAAADLRDVPWALVLGAEVPVLDTLLPPDHAPEHRISWLGKSGIERAGLISFRERGVVLGFRDGLVGGPDPDGRLIDLLRRLEIARPGRPIDSIVLAVPAQLLSSDPEDAQAQQRMEAHGRKLYDLVLAAQSRTGWRVPIYLLVTGSDAIEGFSEIATAILANAKSPMIGWASTRPIDTVFEAAWIDDAFDEMARDLLVAQCHAMMGLNDSESARRALAFPDRMASLQPMMTLLLTQLLNASAYHEGFMLRGVFFTGATPPIGEPPLAIDGPNGEQALTVETAEQTEPLAAPQALAAALFRDKVFPEHCLAQPAYGERTRRHRMVGRTRWAVAAAVVAFVAGIGTLSIGTGRSLQPVNDVLAEIQRGDAPGFASRSGDCTQTTASAQSAADLLRGLAAIQVDRLETVLAPTSFLTNTTAHVRDAIAASFRHVVFAALVERMTSPSGIEGRIREGLPPSTSPGFWPAFVANARAYDAHYWMLADIGPAQRSSTDATKRFGTVASYALGENLPDLRRNDELYAAAIAAQSIPCLDQPRIRAVVVRIVDQAYRDTITAWYAGDPVARHIASIHRDFGNPAALLPPADVDAREAASQMLGRLQELSRLLDALAVSLPGAAQAPWGADPANPPLPDTTPLNLRLVDAATLQSIAATHRPMAIALAAQVRGAKLAGVPLLRFGAPPMATAMAPAAATPPAAPALPDAAAMTDSAGPALSAAAADTQTMLHDVLAQPFVRRADPVALPVPDGLWDLPRLQGVEQLAKKYLGFASAAPATVPQPIIDATAGAVRTRAGRYVALETIASTVMTPSTDEVEASNFVLALPTLQSIQLMLRQFGELEGTAKIGIQINNQADRVVASAERDLDREGGPYAVDRDALLGWNGQDSLAATAFATGTIENLKATLAERRAWVAEIARGRVAPVVTYAREPTNGATAGLVAKAERWAAIVRALDGYDAGPNPNNPITRLERFMTADLDQLQAQGCTGIARVTARGGDYFANQQLRISAEVFGRCRNAVLADLRARYGQLRDSFQATLAGRFPFGPVDAPDADPALVRAFFQQYGAQLAPMQAALEDVSIGRSAASALGALIGARGALAPMLGGNDAASLRYAVGVRFFTDPMIAAGQDQVIEASIGTPISRATTDAPAFVWKAGEPVIARFRWAANAPSLPLSGLALPNGACLPAPDGAWATSRTVGPWALLRLMRRQSSGLDEATAVNGYPAAFGVDLCANLQSAVGGDTPPGRRARLMLRLTLAPPPTAPDEPTTPIALPAFPAGLPPLDTSPGTG
ncbi:type VI secretion system protein [Sphingomonas sp. 37zxx]|uniref:type VI secretion system protein n=1 Tax=Sphingomonas sp. 37zxx TaxID=1550073 RepID=UPI00053BF750|nr:type VI secretion system protein [Sphingomonas sp. 37zxx]